jgi:hypothetical protein
MKKIIAASAVLLASNAFAEGTIVDSIKNGKVSGNVRAYNFIQNKKAGTDKQAFALGGKLHAENAAISGFNVGLTFYVADDMNLVSSQTYKRDTKYKNYAASTADIGILGESYLNYNGYGFNFRTGAQEFVSPFATTSDSQIIPSTFTGHVLNYTGVDNLKLTAAQLNKYKFRNSTSFNNIGAYSVSRATDGVIVGGADYATKQIKATAYYYGMDDLANLTYLTGGYTFSVSDSLAVTPSLQYVKESKTGAALKGDIDSSVMGANLNVTQGDLKFDLAYVSIKETTGKYLNGGLYSPLTITTDPMFTNSMINSMADVGVGSSYKAMVNYTVNPELTTKLSYAKYDYKTDSLDRTETNFDFTYKIAAVQGLQYTNRIGLVGSDTESLKETQWRAQFQFAF